MKQIQSVHGEIVKVDDEDFDFLSRFHCLDVSEDGVSVCFWKNNRKFSIRASHLLVKVKGTQMVVCKNGDNLDLRKENFIIASYSHFNHSIAHNYKNTQKTSIYRGVSFQKEKSRWKWSIMQNGVRYQNTCATEREAGIKYNQKAKELYGDNAYQNIIKK